MCAHCDVILILQYYIPQVHFFRPVPKEYLHSAELRDIMQFGSSNTAVFFKMRVAGVLHIFQFETKQVLAPLQTSSLLINHFWDFFMPLHLYVFT